MKMVDADGDHDHGDGDGDGDRWSMVMVTMHEIHLKNEKLKASVSEGQESQNKERCWKS